jgi:hypothetical protein
MENFADVLTHGPVLAFDPATQLAITCNGKEFKFWSFSGTRWVVVGTQPVEDVDIYALAASAFLDMGKQALHDWIKAPLKNTTIT